MSSAYVSKRGLLSFFQAVGLALVAVAMLALSVRAIAQANDSDSDAASVEETVVVGKHPGPAMWKIEKDGHVLWIFGVMSQLPKSMEWDSTRAERVISESQGFLSPPRLQVVNSSGFFAGRKASREYEQMQKLPEGQVLSDVLPPELLASYLEVKERYAPSNRNIDQLRPFFAAESLLFEAVRTLNLRGVRTPQTLEKIARRHKIPLTSTSTEIPFAVQIETLKQASMASEISCMESTLAYINNDLKFRVNRVHAWVDGDKAALERLAYRNQLPHLCTREATLGEAIQNTESRWLDAAKDALETNQTTFAYLPVHEILAPEGLVAALLNQGYTLVGE